MSLAGVAVKLKGTEGAPVLPPPPVPPPSPGSVPSVPPVPWTVAETVLGVLTSTGFINSSYSVMIGRASRQASLLIAQRIPICCSV